MLLWSAEFVIEDHERLPLDFAAVRVVGPHEYSVVRPWEESAGPSSIRVQVRAENPDQARAKAIEVYEEIRLEAGLATDAAPPALLGRVLGVPYPADRLIFEAQDMLEERRFGLAVVAAQIHCEMWVRATMEQLAGNSSSAVERLAPEIPRSWSLLDPLGRQVFEALTGVDPASAQCWPRYRSHVARRNAFVHRGAEISEPEARESIDAVVEMVRFVEARSTDGGST